MEWNIEAKSKNIKFKEPILIVGLPGIGNVSKITVDFLIDETKAKKVADIFSYNLPHSVFINSKNLIQLPEISLFHKKIKSQDFLFLAGDAQPINEQSTYSFCETILKYLKEYNCKEIICLAGIGLQNEPDKPQLFCTANNKKTLDKYNKEFKIKTKVSGIVGHIIGVSGILPGLAAKENINGTILLTETFAHPLYIGIKGAKELCKKLNQKFKFGITLKKLDKDIRELEDTIKIKTEEINEVAQTIRALNKKEMKYIG